MSLPAFLAPGSPPRSPHVTTHSSQSSYFRLAAPTSRSSPHSVRPTRRDILLVLITLSFSYLLFSSPTPEAPLVPRPAPVSAEQPSRYRLPDWSQLWKTKQEQVQACDSLEMPRERNYAESVRTYGISRASLAEGPDDLDDGRGWDGGVEEAEDDELEGISTVMTGHQAGWTMFERLYIYNGSFYVVTDEKADWPELRLMTSTGVPASSAPGNEQAREPKGDEILFIKPAEAVKLWGPRVLRLDGMTWLINDGQFLDHYYHFAAELLLGLWRTYTSLDQDISATGSTKLAAPQRMWFLHQNTSEWRDKPRFNSVITFALFPSTSMLYPEDFADLKRVTSEGEQKAFMLERAILADRSAAFRGPYTGPTSRTVASALQVGKTSRWWWEALRRQMLRYASVPDSIINRNLEGYGATDPSISATPLLAAPGIEELEPLSPQGSYKPLVTYISRQSSRRRLTAAAHAGLVKALEERAKKVGFELLVIEAEKFSKEEQIAVAARTTIMLGVHGNGLTHLIWMPPTPRSAVIEMFFKGGFARDYQWTAHALGIRHYGVQHDISFTAPHLPEVAYPEGFQGEAITVDGKTVADIIEDRLTGRV